VARIRTVKPELFRHEGLYDLETELGIPVRLAWIGLFTIADREGRFKWRPRAIKAEVLPYDEVDFSRVLDALWTRGFLVKYASNGEVYGAIPSWHRHQVINNREKPSDIPAPNDQTIVSHKETDASSTREAHDDDAMPELKSGREGKGKGKEYSVPNGTGGQPPPTASQWIYAKGRELLGIASKPPKDPGGLISRWLREHGEAALLDALRIAETKRSPDPVALIEGILRKRKQGPPRHDQPDMMGGMVIREVR